MKLLGPALLLSVLSVNAPAQIPRTTSSLSSAIASARLQLTASVEPASVKVGAPVTLKLRLRNISPGRISLFTFSFDDIDYELFVADASGRELQRTPRGQAVFQQDDFPLLKTRQIELDPGAATEATLDVSKIYELTKQGIYYVQAFRGRISPDPSVPRPYAYSNSHADDARISVEKAVSTRIQFTIVP